MLSKCFFVCQVHNSGKKKVPFSKSKIKMNTTAVYIAWYVSDSSVITTATIFLCVGVQDNFYRGYLYWRFQPLLSVPAGIYFDRSSK